MSFFTEAMRMVFPFAARPGGKPEANGAAGPGAPKAATEDGGDMDALRRQMADMEARLEALTRK
jgi:hypothetical protein